jgi:hypothetical protein
VVTVESDQPEAGCPMCGVLADTTVSALARHLGVDLHTAWTAIEAEARLRMGKPERLHNVNHRVPAPAGSSR